MIKFQDKLWYVITASTYQDTNLAYMCHYDKTKACEKRQDTGRRWAQSGEWNEDRTKHTDLFGEEHIVPNLPSTGFKLGSVVSRYSTDNKLFRVTDPRGFEVEISAGNVSALLQDATVINGEVQEECIWGRDSGGNVLVVMDSKCYFDNMAELNKKKEIEFIPFKDLKVGDEVRRKHQWRNDKWIYHGMVTMVYDVKLYPNMYWERQKNIPKQVITDTKKVPLLVCVNDGTYTSIETKNISDITSVQSSGNVLEDPKGADMYQQLKRIKDQIDDKDIVSGYRYNATVKEVIYDR